VQACQPGGPRTGSARRPAGRLRDPGRRSEDPAARFSGRHAGRPPGGRYGREP